MSRATVCAGPLLTASVVIAGFVTLAAATDGFRAVTSEGARRLDVVDSPRGLPAIRMVDHLGRSFGWEDLAGRAALVEFIFTTCPDMCQRMSSELGALVRAEAADGGGETLFLSVSFDPDNDTVEQLRGVARHYGADGETWRFARIADRAALAATLDAFGVVVVPSEVRGFEHNAAIHGIDREGRLARISDIAQARDMLRWARRLPDSD